MRIRADLGGSVCCDKENQSRCACALFWLGLWYMSYTHNNLYKLMPSELIDESDTDLWPCAHYSTYDCPFKIHHNTSMEQLEDFYKNRLRRDKKWD
jgi:hypothetical protein